tara:strand:+ start:3125 stop:3817 length:693 start_codon:yes stop_codon:yes gene_type:complete
MGLLSDIFGGVKVGSSVYEGSEQTNIFSSLMDSLLETAGNISKDAFSNALRTKNEGLKNTIGGITGADSELSKGPLTYSTSKDYQSAAVDATSAVQTVTGTNVAAEKRILADEVKLASGDLKQVANSVKSNLKNLSSLEGVDMAREGFEFTKDSSNAAIGQSFALGYLGSMTGQMKKNYADTGGVFDREVIDMDKKSTTYGELGYEGMFGGRGFKAYGEEVANTKKGVST